MEVLLHAISHTLPDLEISCLFLRVYNPYNTSLSWCSPLSAAHPEQTLMLLSSHLLINSVKASILLWNWTPLLGVNRSGWLGCFIHPSMLFVCVELLND